MSERDRDSFNNTGINLLFYNDNLLVISSEKSTGRFRFMPFFNVIMICNSVTFVQLDDFISQNIFCNLKIKHYHPLELLGHFVIFAVTIF